MQNEITLEDLDNTQNSLNNLVMRGRKFNQLSEKEKIFVYQGVEFERIKKRNSTVEVECKD